MDNIIADWLKQIYLWLTRVRTYNNTTLSYTNQTDIFSNCNEITFINKGTSVLWINNTLPLANNEFIAYDGKKDEVDTTQYYINFDNTGTNLCIVIRKYYN